MNRRMRRFFALAVALLSLGETALVQWAALLLRGSGLTLAQGAVVALGFWLVNAALFPQIRRHMRAGGLAERASRAWILFSIAALLTGTAVAVLLALLATSGMAGEPVGRSAFLWLGGAIVAIGFGSIAWGATVGDQRVRVDRVALPLRHASPAVEELRIAHLTDLHIGPLLRPERLRSFVDRTNALDPDMIVLTGDLFDFDPAYVDDGCGELARLRARHGVFGVLGNHDVATGTDAVVRGLGERTSIRLLRDAWATVELGGDRLVVAGIEDPGEGWAERTSTSPVLERLAREIPADLPCILLAHRPSYFAHAAQLGFSVVLSGHTHGGQVALPIAQNHNPSRVIAHHTRGVFRSGDSTLYVNRGLGMAGLPLRINCPREIALIAFAGAGRSEG